VKVQKKVQKNVRQVDKQTLLLMALSAVVVVIGFMYNPSGQFSDIRPFYGMRYWNGDHPWPFSEYFPPGAATPVLAIEYPALTGLIIWVLTFFVPTSPNSTMHYFYLTSIVHGVLFIILIYLVRRLSGARFAYLLILAPAVVTSLNRNWDIWVMVPTLASILFFESKRYQWSAIMLGIAIATKFFPVVLLLGVAVFFLRNKELKRLITYFFVTFIVWLGINLPVMSVDLQGWSFFYQLSFSRGLGEGSFFTLFSKLGLDLEFNNIAYYFFNSVTFLALLIFIWKSPEVLSLTQSAFLLVTAFTLFGKQYSMQYVLWLAPLAVIAIPTIAKRRQNRLILGYICWQFFEILFHQAYYQNLLARVLESRGTPLAQYWSDFEYGIAGILRYSAFLIFVYLITSSLGSRKRNIVAKQNQVATTRKKK